MEKKQLVNEICKALDAKNAKDVAIIDISASSGLTDYFVIASGRSTTQVKALFESLEETLEKQGVFAVRKEGVMEGKWIAVDYTEVIVHIFFEELRTFYQLEKLWTNGENFTYYQPAEE